MAALRFEMVRLGMQIDASRLYQGGAGCAERYLISLHGRVYGMDAVIPCSKPDIFFNP